MEHLKEIPFLDKYPVFRKLAAIGDLQKLTPEERDYYEEDVKIMRDLYATDKWEKEKRRMEREAARKELEEATKKALTEGRAKGRAKGRAEGRAEGIAEGKAEGRAEGMLEVAKNLLSMDIPILQIMQATGLTQEQIKGLQN
jgi:predicted transposase/invertase (TIGR01784 family)